VPAWIRPGYQAGVSWIDIMVVLRGSPLGCGELWNYFWNWRTPPSTGR
jgi:hypothetical protein